MKLTIGSNYLFSTDFLSWFFPCAELVDLREKKAAGFGDSESSHIANLKFHYALFGMHVNAFPVTQTSKKIRSLREILLAGFNHAVPPSSEGRGHPQVALQPTCLIKVHIFETHPVK